jgi:hypothetical protein
MTRPVAGPAFDEVQTMDPLTLRGFALIAALAAPFGAAAWFTVGSEGNTTAGELAVISCCGGLAVGFLAAGTCYLVAHARQARSVRLSEAELRLGEVVLLESGGSMVHYRTGRPHLPWEAVGGRLVLTNQRLVFLCFRGQPTRSALSIPLGEIQAVRPCPVQTAIGPVPGGLRVAAAGGEQLFGFGAVFAGEAARWSDVIDAARGPAGSP